MPFLEFMYGDVVLGIVLAFLIAGGTLLPTDEFKKFKVAKACWWLLALYLGGRVLMWSVLTSDRLHVRVFWVFLACGIIGVVCSEMVRAIDQREIRLAAAEQEQQKPVPPIQQTSQGSGSPNTTIIGNNNTVINGDPKSAAKLAEILKVLKSEKAEHTEPENFLKKYPLGYILFDIDQKNSVFPYATESLLRNWEFDWNSVKLSEDREKNILWLTLPDMLQKSGQNRFIDTKIGGQKKIGPFDGTFITDGTMAMKGEILSIRPNGIVFLVGFDYAKK